MCWRGSALLIPQYFPVTIIQTKYKLGRLAHTVYRKPTLTNPYLNADSHYHPAQPHFVINTLATRSLKLADQNHQPEEKNNVRRISIQIVYHPKSVDNALRTNNKPPKEKQEPISNVFLPYVKNTTENIGKVLKKYNVDTISMTNNQISNFLPTPKEIIPLEDQGV